MFIECLLFLGIYYIIRIDIKVYIIYVNIQVNFECNVVMRNKFLIQIVEYNVYKYIMYSSIINYMI